MKIVVVLFVALAIVGFGAYSMADKNASEASFWIISYSPNGLTSLASDRVSVYMTNNGIEQKIDESEIINFSWMDNSSALMNRSDGSILIINVVTGQIFLMQSSGQHIREDCYDCIGGGGTDVYYPTSTPITPTAVPTKG